VIKYLKQHGMTAIWGYEERWYLNN
jgi:hypothetical protein